MKNITAVLVVVSMLVFAGRYSYQIWRGKVYPALSTWIIFLVGTGLSLITYSIAENRDFVSGILNTVDVGMVLIILISTLLFGGGGKVRFKPFEKYYLAGVGMIIVYGLASGDAWGSNIFTQVLISIGYFPTIQNLVTEKRNTESFFSWSCALFAVSVALIPASINGSWLAIIYSLRSIVLVLAMLILMGYYQFNCKNKRSDLGGFLRDDSGIWHYGCVVGFTGIYECIEDALRHKPRGIVWFWYNDIPTPIFRNDDKATLCRRWNEWIKAHQEGGDKLQKKIRELNPHP